MNALVEISKPMEVLEDSYPSNSLCDGGELDKISQKVEQKNKNKTRLGDDFLPVIFHVGILKLIFKYSFF